MRLLEALRLDRSSRIAFAGAGGKTTAMFTAARQMPGTVVCLNTAHLAVEQANLADKHVVAEQEEDIRVVFDQRYSGVVLFTGPEHKRGKLAGVSRGIADSIRKYADEFNLPVLIEADGSRMLPLKAPATHEPPIPAWVNHVVYMIGLSALGKSLTAENVFRPEIFSDLTGMAPDSNVDVGAIQRISAHPEGALKNIPSHARRTLFANQIDDCPLPESELINALKPLISHYDAILAGSLHQPEAQIHSRQEKIAGIVLAAGGANRMGQVKQLLLWQEKPLVRHVTETAIKAGLDPVIVVTGSSAKEVQDALVGLPVEVVYNPAWETGQSSSIRTGLGHLPEHSGAAIFLLSDMPQTPLALVRQELEIHQKEPVAIICPRVSGQRTNPALFDRQTFADLSALTGDIGGRALFDAYPVRWLEWEDAVILQDIDTMEDYQTFIEGGGDDQ